MATIAEKLARIRALCRKVDDCAACPVAITVVGGYGCPFAGIPERPSWRGPPDWKQADAALAKLDAEWLAKLDAPAGLTAELDAPSAIVERLRDDALADRVADATDHYTAKRDIIDGYRRAVLGREDGA